MLVIIDIEKIIRRGCVVNRRNTIFTELIYSTHLKMRLIQKTKLYITVDIVITKFDIN